MAPKWLPQDPTGLFDLAGQIADRLAEKRIELHLTIALKLVTRLNAAMRTVRIWRFKMAPDILPPRAAF